MKTSDTLSPRERGAVLDTAVELPTEPSDTDERWRYLPQRALLVPPSSGPHASDLVKAAPRVMPPTSAYNDWLGALARSVRLGDVSPEAAVLAASLAGERNMTIELAGSPGNERENDQHQQDDAEQLDE